MDNRGSDLDPHAPSRKELLRMQAESLLKIQESNGSTSADLTTQLLHELQVYTIELELQNEQLQVAQQSIEHSLQHYRTLYDFAPIGYVTIDKNCRIVELNAAFANLVGGQREDLLYSFFNALIHSEDRERFEALIGSLNRTPDTSSCELRLWHANAQQREVRLECTLWQNIAPGHFLIGVVDMSEHNQLERERFALQRKMQELEHVDTLRLVAGGMAHDLNNLHMVMFGNLDLALEQIDEFNPLRPRLQTVVDVLEDAARLLKQTLHFATGGKMELNSCELNALITGARGLLQTGIQGRVPLELRTAAHPVPVRADPQQLRQLLLNLVKNAAEASVSYGTSVVLEIGTAILSEADLVRCRVSDTALPGTYGFICIRDRGHGMDEAALQRILIPYQSTKSTGHGLGLYMVRTIIRLHQGALQIKSRVGDGTTFIIYIPADTQAISLTQPTMSSPEQSVASTS